MNNDEEKIRRLQLQKKNLLKKITKLTEVINGSIKEVFLPCGKKNCRCTKGELHGPKHHLTWRENNRTRIFYVRESKLKDIQKGIKQYKKAKELLKEAANINLLIDKIKRTSEDK